MKKPHERPSDMKKVFQAFRARVEKRTASADYEVRPVKDGFDIIVHRERGLDERLHFATRAEVDAYLERVEGR